MKTKFNSDDHLPLNKQLKFRSMIIIIRSVFEEDATIGILKKSVLNINFIFVMDAMI